MNISQHPTERAGHARWPKIAAATWLLLISALALINSVRLLHLAERSRASDQGAHVQALATRVGDLERETAALKRQPKSVAQPDFDAARQVLEARLAQVEQAQAAGAHADDLRTLQARVGTLETRWRRASLAASTASRRMAAAVKPRPPTPPFSMAVVELRGGERFLSVAAVGATSLRESKLMREGDAVGAWQLQAIESHAAVFSVDGQTQRIALP